MRIRIVARVRGEVDGVSLEQFTPGHVYDVNASIGSYLIVCGWAAPVADDSPARVVPIKPNVRLHPPLPPHSELPTLSRRLGARRLSPPKPRDRNPPEVKK